MATQDLLERFTSAPRAFQPVGQGLLQAVDLIARALLLGLRGRRNVKRDAEVAVLSADIGKQGHGGEARLILECLLGADDASDVGVREEALRALAGNFVYRVDEEDPSPACLGLSRAADHYAGFHG